MRIVLKVSGESLKGSSNIDEKNLATLYDEVLEISKKNELIIIVGGGNFWRGRNKLDIDPSTSDYIGMLGTVMNALSISSYLNKKGIATSCYSSFEILGIVKKAISTDIEDDLSNGKVIVLGGGLGIPNLSTDMTTVSKAIEYNADLILMAKNIDGVYDKDPSLEGAKKIDRLTHDELLKKSFSQGIDSLMVLDAEALVELAKYRIPIYIYNAKKVKTISDVLDGKVGTKIVS